ncbi:hypothetical protein J5N97_021312 [Dioscorea zingiberensis]|uniref:Late embryogenesis abundant protein LEA-2 subgroup domain-containing protein n=1 Tax=Dioscorea zingiberensis TaxID=325984 RepID=A0A9D5HEH9_9LILI|nr:hypothetical protein J5N97_021312 [Dioscorea zingiberensis]
MGRRSSDCGLCWLCCSLLKLIISIAITVGAVISFIWLVFRPNEIKVHVDDATLSRFTLTANSTLLYNLTLAMTVRNPNRRIAIYYDYLEAQAFYSGERFGLTTVPPFYQGHKTSSQLSPEFHGKQQALTSVNATFTREKGEGSFYVDVNLYTKIRLKVWIFKIHGLKPEIRCNVKLPAPAPARKNTTTIKFETTKCDVDLF